MSYTKTLLIDIVALGTVALVTALIYADKMSHMKNELRRIIQKQELELRYLREVNKRLSKEAGDKK